MIMIYTTFPKDRPHPLCASACLGSVPTEVLEVRLITPGGAIWQRHGDPKAQAETAIGRASTNIGPSALA